MPYTGSTGSQGGCSFTVNANAGNADCTGAISSTFAYAPAAGATLTTDPVPQSVIMTESSSENANTSSYGTMPNPTGSCSTGLGGSAVQMTDSPGPGNPPVSESGTASAGMTRYTMQSGASSIPLTCSPVAQATASNEILSLNYTAIASAVTISLGGATSDGNGGYDIAVGQHCSPALSGIPAGCTVSNYSWTVSGMTFQSWTVSADQTHTTEVDGPGPKTGPNPNSNPAIPAPQWYWNDANTTLETITCSATVTPPAGDGAAFTVMATQKVNVMVPTVAVYSLGGVGRINNTNAALENKKAGYWLYAGSTVAGMADAGDTWYGTVTESAPISGGTWAFVQIITPSAKNGSVVIDSNTGLTGLDGVFPYSGPYNADGTQVSEGDSPGEPLLDSYANMTIADSFMVYVMYLPKDGNWVAIAYMMKWTFNTNDTRPSSGHWADYTPPDAAGTVTPGSGTFKPQSTFPTWTRINK